MKSTINFTSYSLLQVLKLDKVDGMMVTCFELVGQ